MLPIDRAVYQKEVEEFQKQVQEIRIKELATCPNCIEIYEESAYLINAVVNFLKFGIDPRTQFSPKGKEYLEQLKREIEVIRDDIPL